MKYFIDTEFIECFHKHFLGKKRHFIDLISIGIVAEDGREYYAVSNEYRYKDADEWVRKNVISPLYIDTVHGDHRNRCDVTNFQNLFGKSNKQIAKEITEFVYADIFKNFKGAEKEFHLRTKEYGWETDKPIEFYGYYADYDWVLFCSLFGRMIDLPRGFPMYCRDLKQELDKISDIHFVAGRIQNHAKYPKQENEHNALADAKWNLELYNFLKGLGK
jgi:hypothetical protein